MTLTVGSLFSGIGGLDLGLERAGMKVIWQSEIDPYATRVLAKHWPEVPNHGDITRIDWRNIVRPDVICGGYPCQPFSTAGQRKGEEDPRHLWPWVREAIRVLRPRYAILENVRGHLSLGGTTVLSEIAALGYSAEWRVISAASVGANHRRDRVIIVAYPDCQRRQERNTSTVPNKQRKHRRRGDEVSMADTDGSNPTDGGERPSISGEDRSRRNDRGGSHPDPREIALRSAGQDPGYVADPDDPRSRTPGRDTERERSSSVKGRQELAQPRPSGRGANVENPDSRRLKECKPESEEVRLASRTSQSSRSDLSDPESRVDVRGDGQRPDHRGEIYGGNNLRRGAPIYAIGEWWQTEPDVGRVANGVPARVDRLKGLGNAVVPQVAEVIGRLVVAHADQNPD